MAPTDSGFANKRSFMIKSFRLTLLCLFLVQNSFAQNFLIDKSDHLLLGGDGITVRTDSPLLTQNHAARLNFIFEKVRNITANFDRPKHVSVLMAKTRSGGQASPSEDYFAVGLLGFRGEDLPVFTFAHEYGHLIFNSPHNLKAIDLTPEALLQSDYVNYDEFFSYLIAVLATEDPTAGLSDSLKYFGKPLTGMGFIEDGFIPPKHDFEKGIFREPYDYFFSARKFLWSYFLANDKSDQSARVILKATYEVIGDELKKRGSNPKYGKMGQIPTNDEIKYFEDQFLRALAKKLR